MRGWFAYNRHDVQPGWWGPVGYHPVFRPVHGPVYREGYHPAYRPVTIAKPADRTASGTTRTFGVNRQTTLYDRWAKGVQRHTIAREVRAPKESEERKPEVRPRPVPVPREEQVDKTLQQPPTPVERRAPVTITPQNNVYTTPKGEIMRQTPSGWEQRTQNTWKESAKVPASSGVARDSQVRQRGEERTSSFSPPPRPAPQPRPTPPPPPKESPRPEEKKR